MDAIGRLLSRAEVPLGTAFAVDKGLALTAFHCVGDRHSGNVVERSVLIRFGRTEIAAEVAGGSGLEDWAILKLREPLPEGVRPLPLASHVPPSASFRAFGYPSMVSGTEGFAVSGGVTWPDARLTTGAPVIQLSCFEAAAGLPMQGLSGAPVFVGNPARVVGLIRWNEPRLDDPTLAAGGSLFACPTRVVIDQLESGMSAEPDVNGSSSTLRAMLDSQLVRAREALTMDIPVGREALRIQSHEHSVTSVDLSRDGALLATAGLDDTARLWRTDDGECLIVLHQRSPVKWVRISPSVDLIATAGGDGVVRVYDVASGRTRLESQPYDWLRAVSWHPKGERLMVVTEAALIWNLLSDRIELEIRDNPPPKRRFQRQRPATAWMAARYNDRGDLIATGGTDGRARIWNADDGSLLHEMDHTLFSQSSVTGVAFIDDWLVTASDRIDQTVWSCRTGQNIAKLKQQRVRGFGFRWAQCVDTCQEKYVAYGNTDGTSTVWSMDGFGWVPVMINRHANRLTQIPDIAVRRSGQLVATAGGEEQTARVWVPAD